MQRIYIKEASKLLNRREATLRGWERDKRLPRHLVSERDEKGWRYWTTAQIADILKWMVDTDLRPGKGLAHYKPTPAQLEKHLANQRTSDGDLG